jgi:hypothetical protein
MRGQPSVELREFGSSKASKRYGRASVERGKLCVYLVVSAAGCRELLRLQALKSKERLRKVAVNLDKAGQLAGIE